jgi:hypothetical protein
MSKDWLLMRLAQAVSNADYTLARYLNEQIKLLEETNNVTTN